jgi:hypothetical protein
LTDLDPQQYRAIIPVSSTMINIIPAHKIIFDFPLAVILFVAAVYKVIIFALSYCWQVMARTKTRLKSGYIRERTVNGTTITTRFIPTNPKPRTIRLRTLEREILRNFGIIQNFTVAHASKPTSDDQALYQRQRYQTTGYSVFGKTVLLQREKSIKLSHSQMMTPTHPVLRLIMESLRHQKLC